MFCNSCGKSIPDDARLCPYCGNTVASASPRSNRLVRPRQGRRIAGVCLGLANYFGLNATLVRIVWLLLLVVGGVGLIPYLILWIVMPNDPA